jgi:GNAT superfamily N-acetyltransferase
MFLIQIRKARKNEASIIVHHRIEMFRSMGRSEEQLSAIERATIIFLDKPWERSIDCYFALQEKEVVGGCAVSFCIAYPTAENPSGKFAHLFNMYVEPEHRGKGVATSLVKHITQLCLKKGIRKMTLHATKMSKGIYEKEGFVKSENYYMKTVMD